MGNGFSSRSRYISISTAVIASVISIPASAQVEKHLNKAKHVPGEVIVRLRDSGLVSAQGAVFSNLLRSLGENSVLSVKPFETDKQLHVVRLAKDSDLETAMSRLKNDPKVEIAEPNYLVHAFDDGTPNDPSFSKLWGLKNTGQADAAGQVGTVGSDINILPLWQKGFTGNRNVLVAVIDTGIDWTHPDLVANLYTNPAEANGAKDKDNDGNGFVYDIHGWNFAAHTNNSNDDHGHGSHCSGTIGGNGNNGVGVAGINWQVSLLPVKFLDAQGSGSLQGAIEAINYARMMKVNVMSNSWGGGGFSDTLRQAIDAVRSAGILFVAAAGNDSSNNDTTPSYPAAYDLDNIVAVAATDNKDGIASFSNYGIKSVHVAAPGVKIFSTVKAGGYDTYSGTSMACPHVAGISALLLSENPTWTYAEIKDRLIRTSVPVAGLRRKVLAKGRVNASNAFYNIVPPSTEPAESDWKDFPLVIESDHPYKDKSDKSIPVKVPNAKMIRVHFEKVDVEAKYDHVLFESPSGALTEDVTGTAADYATDYIKGDSAVIHFKSDTSVNGWGYKIDKVQYIP